VSVGAAWLFVVALWLGCLLPASWWLAPLGLVGLLAAAAPGPVVRGRLPLALVAVACAGAGLAGGRVEVQRLGVLPSLAELGSAVELTAVVVTDPRALPGGGWWQLAGVRELDGRRVRERVLLRWPAGSVPARLGERVRVEASLRPLGDGGFARHMRSLHAVAQARVRTTDERGPPARLLALTETARERTADAVRRGLPPEQAGLLLGMVTGDTAGAERVRDAFDRSGLTHLIVVSGGQVATVALAMLALGRLVGAGFRGRRLLALAGVAWFGLLARPEPPVLRAVAAAGIVLGAQLVGRRADTRYALAVAVLVLLLADPMLARQAGFQLSVAATLAVLALAPPLARRLPGPRPLRRLAAAGLAAQLAVSPVLLAAFDAVPVLAIPANLVAVPAAGVAQSLGLATAALAQPLPPLATLAARLAAPPLSVVIAAADVFSRGPVITRSVLVPPGVGRLLPGRLPAQVSALTLTALDVGQGDALLIEAPGHGRAVRALVDAGPDERRAVDLLRRLGVEVLDLAVLSHGDLDHSGGMAAVLRALPVGALVVASPPASVGQGPGQAVLRAAAERGVPVVRVHAGQRVALGDSLLEVLAPPASGFPGASANEHSLVLRAHGPGGRILLTGDVEAIGQAWLLTRPERLRAEVLKVPHHGGNTNAEGFLEAVGARSAVVSVGRGNSYGHPHPAVLAALRGVPVLRTDERGMIRVSLDALHQEETASAVLCRTESRHQGRAGRIPGAAGASGAPVADARGLTRAVRRTGRVRDHRALHGRQHRHVPRQPLPPRPVGCRPVGHRDRRGGRTGRAGARRGRRP
jgi:competence protein ComEC